MQVQVQVELWVPAGVPVLLPTEYPLSISMNLLAIDTHQIDHMHGHLLEMVHDIMITLFMELAV
jgi:hypothetical protein